MGAVFADLSFTTDTLSIAYPQRHLYMIRRIVKLPQLPFSAYSAYSGISSAPVGAYSSCLERSNQLPTARCRRSASNGAYPPATGAFCAYLSVAPGTRASA